MSEDQALQSYEEALNTIEALNPAPQILAKAQKRLRDPSVEVDEIESIIRADASLTADLIRISNSAFYGYETKASNLHEAIHRIGFGEITRIIGLSISKSLLEKELSHYEIPQDDYWGLSLSVGLLMERLARMHMEAPEDAYTVGLLHAVGRIVINQLMDDFGIEEQWDHTQPVHEWERDAIGFTGAYAGAMILKRWDFSTKITHPILYQLNKPKAEMGWSLHAYLYFARKLVKETGIGFENLNYTVDDEMKSLFMMLTLQKESLDDAIKDCKAEFDKIKSGLDI